jgi:hypothetical protein
MSQQMAFDLPEFSREQEVHSTSSIGNVAWSYSRRGTLEQCPRRYYFTYYSSNEGLINGQSQIRLLSRLQNRYERTGQILHLVISTFLRKGSAGDFWHTNRLCNWAEDMFNRDCGNSKRASNDVKADTIDFTKFTYLQEFYYGESDAEAMCEVAKHRLIQAITEFAENHVFSALRDAAM